MREFEQIPREINKGLPKQVFSALTLLEVAIKNNVRWRSGLNVRSGSLLNSIQKRMTVSRTEIEGFVGSMGVPYAATHEFGATIPARTIEPRNAKMLRWFDADGNPVFAKKVNIPSYEIKARPFIQPAIDELGPTILDKFGLFVEFVASKERR